MNQTIAYVGLAAMLAATPLPAMAQKSLFAADSYCASLDISIKKREPNPLGLTPYQAEIELLECHRIHTIAPLRKGLRELNDKLYEMMSKPPTS